MKEDGNYECEKNPKDNYHFTPLYMAAMNGHHQICKLIIENVCGNPNPRSDQGDPKNPQSNDGTTPLHNNAVRGHLQVCQLIVENAQEKNPIGRYMCTPFDYAQRNGHAHVVKFFCSIYNCDRVKSRKSPRKEKLALIKGIHKVTFCSHGCGQVE